MRKLARYATVIHAENDFVPKSPTSKGNGFNPTLAAAIELAHLN